MDRRKFLTRASSLALLPLLPWSKEWKAIGVRWDDIEKRWVPKDWYDTGVWIAQSLQRRMCKRHFHTTQVFYDVISWRNMLHNWIGWCNCTCTDCFRECSIPIRHIHPHIRTIKIPVMGSKFPCDFVDYPERDYWSELRNYGKYIATAAQNILKGNYANNVY